MAVPVFVRDAMTDAHAVDSTVEYAADLPAGHTDATTVALEGGR